MATADCLTCRRCSIILLLLLFHFQLLVVCMMVVEGAQAQAQAQYRDALAKSILFFQGQRSGRLPPPPAQEFSWRANSGRLDGRLAGVDLSGGYYDAGDNVKFNFPMAFTTTMLSWGVIDYGKKMGPQLGATRSAIRWATDYLLKCARATPGKLYVGVGDPNSDHRCWERPEDMDPSSRTVYSVSPNNPGSDVAGETAAALAAASMVFRKADPNYSKLLLTTAKVVMQFGMHYRGSYSDSLGSSVCPFYCSYSGYTDELLWGAAWIFRATNDVYYLNLIRSLGQGANEATDIFSWDNKYAGAHLLLARRSLVGGAKADNTFESFRHQTEDFMCRILPNSPYSSTQYTRGGLMFKMSASNLQYVTSITFLLTTYSKYMASASASRHSTYTFNCGSLVVTSRTLRSLAKSQVDYILGDNPMKMSYMVGFLGLGTNTTNTNSNYPRRIHHRGSSLPSIQVHPQSFGCEAGFQPFYYTSNPNPNTLTGAIVGGPNQNDFFPDERTDYMHSEPATYINAAIVGPLAYFAGTSSS